MHRVSTDPKDYSFSEKATRDIAQKVETYRASPAAVREALVSLQRGGAALTSTARSAGIAQPYFVFYAALAITDGGRSGRDPVTTIQSALPDLIALRTHFGDDAESTLLVIAAYPEGPGTKKSHPLLRRLTQIANSPVAQRNVWYVHDKGGIDAEAYDLVLRFIALGVIAQNPKQFGVNAEPLSF